MVKTAQAHTPVETNMTKCMLVSKPNTFAAQNVTVQGLITNVFGSSGDFNLSDDSFICLYCLIFNLSGLKHHLRTGLYTC